MSGVNGTSCTLFILQLVLHILSIYDIKNKECLVQQAPTLSTIALGCAGYILINCQVIPPLGVSVLPTAYVICIRIRTLHFMLFVVGF